MISPIVGATGSGLPNRRTGHLSHAPPTSARRPAGVTATTRAPGIRCDLIARHPNDLQCEINRLVLNDEASATRHRVAITIDAWQIFDRPARDRLPSSKRRDAADDGTA
ncbi:hypothetical protein [Burkholderia pyrrocinia]|uniref:hypothetical protein n=1 Tax=Burkholderia pyrrocinia TaxID=60550 RepID=UPI00158E0A9F|nr:hypothetical protein [Burkholderia pyrrocinia]